MKDLIVRAMPLWAFSDLKIQDPMTWITGARQVGKTFLAKQQSNAYYNWDTPEVKQALRADPYFFRGKASTIIFDEIHKRRDWKKILKGYYDSPTRKENFIVTGSGRFDQYQKGGDSLQGRYYSYQLWPISYDEYHATSKVTLAEPRDWSRWEPEMSTAADDELVLLGGFPAPLLSGKMTTLRRWERSYLDRIIKEDVRDFSAIHRIDQLDLLARLLPERVGSPLSIKGLSEDIEASTVGVTSWIRLLEVLYLGFLIAPYHHRIARAVKKEKKWYFSQWTYVKEEGARFENYIAVQLSAACAAWTEQGHGRWELFYLRDQDRREVDFILTLDHKPKVLIEAKSSLQSWPAGLSYYCNKLGIPGILVYPKGPTHQTPLGWSLPSSKLLKGLLFT